VIRRCGRGVLVAFTVAALVSGCTSKPAAPAPDELLPLLAAATADATAATAAAKAFPDNGPTYTVVAAVRRQQAKALRTEVDRAAGTTAPPTTTSTSSPPLPPASETSVNDALHTSLAKVPAEVNHLLPRLSPYRAGLAGSIAAGCASLDEALSSAPITATTATSAAAFPDGTAPPEKQPLSADTVAALQQALGAEHAALWLYGTASAFVAGSAETEILAAMASVQKLRDATEQRLSEDHVTPQPAQPAYVVPKPVTDQASALAALGIAESDATVAWRSVLEHQGNTDVPSVATEALNALVDSAVRETRWRRLSGQTPASIALPGSAT
jgi:uncharacterized protein DUF4439